MNKGFTIIELLIVMMLVTLNFMIFSSRLVPFDNTYIHPESCLLKAMALKERCHYTKNLHFNENGNINKAQTLKILDKTCVFQLGMGRYECE